MGERRRPNPTADHLGAMDIPSFQTWIEGAKTLATSTPDGARSQEPGGVPERTWTTINDIAERRRIQNRLAQRSYRQKLKQRLSALERAGSSDDGRPPISGWSLVPIDEDDLPPLTRSDVSSMRSTTSMHDHLVLRPADGNGREVFEADDSATATRSPRRSLPDSASFELSKEASIVKGPGAAMPFFYDWSDSADAMNNFDFDSLNMVGAVFQDFSFPALPQEVQLGSENPFNTNSASIIGCGISALDAEISECLLELQHDRRSRLPKSWMSHGPEATRPEPSWTALEDANKVTTPTLASADDKIPALQDIHGVGTLPQSSSPIQSPSLGKSSPSTATSGSEQSTSFEDSTDDEYSIERSTEEALSHLSRHTPVILRLTLQRFAQWQNGGQRLAGSGKNRSRGASPPSNSPGDVAGSRKGSKQQATRRKRIEDGEGTGSGADDDEENRSRGNKKARLDTTEDDKTPLFACPFYKHDIGKYHKCLSFTLRRIKDVKQHLLRRHLQPLFCITCGEVFESQEAQEAHLLARSCTRPESFSRPEGITTDQRDKLTTRVSKTLSADQQWFSVWRIIWPTAEPPVSPYVSTAFVEVIDEVRKFWSSHGREIIAEQLNTADTPYDLPAEERLLTSLFLNCGERIMQMFTDRLGARGEGPSISGREGNLPADADRASSTGAVGSQTSMPGLTSEEGSDPLQEPPEHLAQDIYHDLIHAPQGLDCAQWSADMAPHTRGLVPIDADSQEFSTSVPELHSLYPEVYTNGAGEEIPFINMDVENSVEFDKAMLAFDDMLGQALSSHDPQPKDSSHTNRHEVLGGLTQQLDSWPWSS